MHSMTPTLPETEDAVHGEVWLGGHRRLAARRCLRRLLLCALLLETLRPQERLQRHLQWTLMTIALQANASQTFTMKDCKNTCRGSLHMTKLQQ